MMQTSSIPEARKNKSQRGRAPESTGMSCLSTSVTHAIINSANNIRSCSVVVQQLLVSLLMVSLSVSAAHEQQKAQGSAGRKTPQTQIHPPQ